MLTPERQTCKILACAQARLTWGCSSAGRASRSQRGGRGFESHHLHHVVTAGQGPYCFWPVFISEPPFYRRMCKPCANGARLCRLDHPQARPFFLFVVVREQLAEHVGGLAVVLRHGVGVPVERQARVAVTHAGLNGLHVHALCQ